KSSQSSGIFVIIIIFTGIACTGIIGIYSRLLSGLSIVCSFLRIFFLIIIIVPIVAFCLVLIVSIVGLIAIIGRSIGIDILVYIFFSYFDSIILRRIIDIVVLISSSVACSSTRS